MCRSCFSLSGRSKNNGVTGLRDIDYGTAFGALRRPDKDVTGGAPGKCIENDPNGTLNVALGHAFQNLAAPLVDLSIPGSGELTELLSQSP